MLDLWTSQNSYSINLCYQHVKNKTKQKQNKTKKKTMISQLRFTISANYAGGLLSEQIISIFKTILDNTLYLQFQPSYAGGLITREGVGGITSSKL